MWIVAIVVWIGGDMITTYHGLEVGFKEANFIAKYFLDIGGYSGMAFSKFVILGILYLLCRLFLDRPYRIIVPILVIIIGSVVSSYNVYKIVGIGWHRVIA